MGSPFQWPAPANKPEAVKAWLRKWEIFVSTPDQQNFIMLSSSDYGAQTLSCSFEIDKPGYVAFWYADIEIYNVDEQTTETLVTNELNVVMNGGYENGQFGQLFSGRVYQALWERENLVDWKITLHCVQGLNIVLDNPMTDVMGSLASQRDIIWRIAKNAMNPINIGTISDKLDNTTKLARGVTFFGTPQKYFDQIAAQNSMQMWTDDSGNVNFGNLEVLDMNYNEKPPDLVYAPETGLVGVPEQTDKGVSFKVFLDARLMVKYPPMRIKIDNTTLRLLKRNFGQHPTILDQDGIYNLLSVRHIGQTRGNDWYTEVVATYDPSAVLLGSQQ